jgi:hypothetical protein
MDESMNHKNETGTIEEVLVFIVALAALVAMILYWQ